MENKDSEANKILKEILSYLDNGLKSPFSPIPKNVLRKRKIKNLTSEYE